MLGFAHHSRLCTIIGDAVALMTAVRMVQRTLELYEHEANLIATANGWIPQSSFS